jgi:GNAT superfamily N-acetyltransferase
VSSDAIRPASAGDLSGLTALLAQLRGASVAGDGQAARLLGLILANPDRRLVVAEADERLVGTADGICVPNLTGGGRPWVGVENVVVDADRRREGIGTALLAHLCDWAAERGAYKVQLMTGTTNPGKLDFYRRAGFEPRSGFRRYL